MLRAIKILAFLLCKPKIIDYKRDCPINITVNLPSCWSLVRVMKDADQSRFEAADQHLPKGHLESVIFIMMLYTFTSAAIL